MTAQPLGETAADRQVLKVTGKDRFSFLQGLISNDMLPLERAPGLIWAALLTAQGKYLADFFVLRPEDGDHLWLDIKTDLAADTARRLSLYRLRADVQITATDLSVTRGLGPAPRGAWPDPRHPALGWRAYGQPGHAPRIDWDALRVAHCIPESGIELIPNESYLLESGFERLHGVDFRKGCYVGQEVTARMKHKTELRKGLVTVRIEGSAPVGTPILSDGKEAGTLFTQSGGQAIAYLRFDRMQDMQAGTARLHPLA
ncbi:folate-binding protein YgfZ [Pseudorhodobacter sp. MZDSW-24AT]|uniref:CAF17-like 4Fe-4S cluster assembly/insertion protein YgfZ n=1 Tax=Pseudorhodobacter sp. MZDSW-24AT TaxID=2052957 RepID=UPI000C1E894D|nr:folate-binding protein YgfZ [Pseudorhodobacter sp. MZDSW-24AT]PJF08176.1 folate-binding protein YgfZ [Pseudorhodobacter sp. MZDSW-24AT]